MKKFRERNPLAVAAVAAAILVIAALIALNISRLPLISHQRTYQADFATAVGLKNGDVVTIAGVRVGAITALSLHGDVARVSFTVNGGPRIGVDSEVHAKVLNPVGVEYIQIEPRGPGHLDQPVPVTRTTVAGTLVGDLNQLTRQTQQTNIPQLVKALGVLGQTLSAGSPAETKAAIDGVAHLSSIFAARQGEISDLIDQANQLTAVLNSHDSQLVGILGQADLVLQVLNQRKAAIDNLLKTTTTLTNQIDHVIVGDRSTLDPVLANLNAVSAFLARDSRNVSEAMPLLAAFSRYAANVTGSGPYADFVAPTLVVPDNLIAQCAALGHLDPERGCRP